MPAAPAVPLTPELLDTILERIASGESLRRICRDHGMPDKSQIMRLRLDDQAFANQYARAREIQAETLADEIFDIADDGSNDTYVIEQGEGKDPITGTDHDVIARSRLRVDTRKWYLSKVLPKVYGDKIQQEVTGENGGPLVFKVERAK